MGDNGDIAYTYLDAWPDEQQDKESVGGKKVKATCLHCGQDFHVYARQVRQGRGKYCSQACSHAHRRGQPRALGKRLPPEEKACLVCGKTFMVGSGTGHKRQQVYCSWVCGGLGKPRHPEVECAGLSVAHAAYLAGIIDGEGQIALRRIRSSGTVFVDIGVTNSYRPLLDWIVQTTGVGGVWVHHPAGRNGEHWKQTWVWRCQSQKAASILAQVRPYLTVKAERADLALQTQDRLMVPALRGDQTWQREAFERMKALNRQGTQPDAWLTSPLPVAAQPPAISRGEARPNAVLTEAKVRAIRAAHAAGGTTIKALAEHYGVHRQTIVLVLKRKNWKHVADLPDSLPPEPSVPPVVAPQLGLFSPDA